MERTEEEKKQRENLDYLSFESDIEIRKSFANGKCPHEV